MAKSPPRKIPTCSGLPFGLFQGIEEEKDLLCREDSGRPLRARQRLLGGLGVSVSSTPPKLSVTPSLVMAVTLAPPTVSPTKTVCPLMIAEDLGGVQKTP